MNSPEMSRVSFELREDLVRELIYPESIEFIDSYESNPATENPVRDFLYKPMEQTGSAQIMIDFIDLAGEQIDLDDKPFSDDNFVKFVRILGIITNMPESVPIEDRLRVYDRALEAEYIQALDLLGLFKTAKNLLVMTQNQ